SETDARAFAHHALRQSADDRRHPGAAQDPRSQPRAHPQAGAGGGGELLVRAKQLSPRGERRRWFPCLCVTSVRGKLFIAEGFPWRSSASPGYVVAQPL